MDTLSLLMQILGIIVNCAKAVAIIVIATAAFALVKYLCLRLNGLLPTVAATTFVFSILSANFIEFIDFASLLRLRLFMTVRAVYGGLAFFVASFVLMLCCAIAAWFKEIPHKAVSFVKMIGGAKKECLNACGASNSFLAITPVLLS